MRLVGLCCLVLAAAATAAAAGPLDKPAFTASPAELLAEAAAAKPAGHEVAVLRDDVTVTLDARGRAVKRYRTVFTVVEPSGADDWGTIGLDWQPFYQDKPTLRARVISADGSVTELDQALLHDAPSVNESPTVFSDRRDLSAPLPRLAVGAVVEEEFVFTDREPLLAAGTVHWVAPLRGVPIARKVITISSPTARKATVVTRGPALGWKPRTQVVGDRTVVSYDLANLAPYQPGFPGTPADWLSSPMIGVATGASWAAVAADYRGLVEAKLATPVTVPPELLAPTPRATVDRIVAWLHGRVRYTGIELSQSAIVPFAPADTLARGFGDCKDKATLLVALLRAAKIPADLALLSTGPGTDVDVALPGMGEFDHAIVRAVVDGKDLWIDATEDLLRAGQLPVRDQQRRALIVAAATKALTTTPGSTPADNLVREVRTFHLLEHGNPKVTEVSEERGIWADNLRGFVRNNTKDDVRKQLGKYADDEYHGTLAGFSSTDPHDLTIPFTLTIDVDATKRSGWQRSHLWTALYPTDVLDKLPESFTSSDADIATQVKDRKVDYVWSYPHTYEIVHRLELPSGYSPPSLPASETRALGTMTLSTTRALAAGVYTVTYRLDTGKQRITADQLRATRDAVRVLRAEDGAQINSTLDAAQLAGEGKVGAAIAEYRRLIALHPKEAIHHGQLAAQYLDAGMGEAARREAKLATTIEPTDGDAWAVLAFILARDLQGRRGLPGSDRAGAIAALRKAVALNPAHIGAKADLAGLLSSGKGQRLSDGAADHRAALPLLLELKAMGEDSYDQRIVGAALFAGDAAALAEFARAHPDSPARQRALVSAAALTSGEEAVRVATAAGADREALLSALTDDLIMLRRYDALRAVVRARPSLSAQRRTVLDRLKRVDLAKLDPADPTTPARLAVVRMALGPVAKPPWSAELETAMAELQDDQLQTGTLGTWPEAAMIDLIGATGEITTTGDAKRGWRVVVDTLGRQFAIYVVKRGPRAVLIGGPELPVGVGAEALAAIGRGDLVGARAWLTRLADDPTTATTTLHGTFLARHHDQLASAERPLLELTASLLMGAQVPASAASALRSCAGLTATDDVSTCARFRFAAAGVRRDWPEAVAAGRAVVAASPDDLDALGVLARVLTQDGKAAEAASLLDAALAKHPNADAVLTARAEVALASGWADAEPWFARATSNPGVGLQALNNAAWAHLYFDPTLTAARALIDRAMARGDDAPGNVLNTYAAVLAEDGEPYLAWKQLARSLETRALDDADRYVLGRIAESYGLRDDAIAIYRTIAVAKLPAGMPSTHDLTIKRLKALGVTP